MKKLGVRRSTCLKTGKKPTHPRQRKNRKDFTVKDAAYLSAAVVGTAIGLSILGDL